MPFDWQLPTGTGVSVQIANRTDASGGNALRILFGQGRATFPGASQMIVLSPGSYCFDGVFLGDLVGRRGLQWKAVCVDAPAVPLGASRLFNGAVAAWSKFDFAFAVPASGCPAQIIQLFLDARSESEKLLTGVAWYGELRITRTEPAKPQ